MNRDSLASNANGWWARWRDTSVRLLSIAVVVALWHLVVWLWSPALLPPPFAVFERLFYEVFQGDLPTQMMVTLGRILASFLLALGLGLVIGLLMGHFKRVNLWLDALLTIFLNIPALVVIILCLMWIGLNEVAAIAAVVINKTPNMIVIFREGAKAIDRQLLEVAQVFRLPPLKCFSQVYLPQLYPYVLAATRAGQALVWKIVLVVELLGCSDGVGFKLGVFFQMFDITSILAYTLAFVAVIYAFEAFILRPWEARINRWQSC